MKLWHKECLRFASKCLRLFETDCMIFFLISDIAVSDYIWNGQCQLFTNTRYFLHTRVIFYTTRKASLHSKQLIQWICLNNVGYCQRHVNEREVSVTLDYSLEPKGNQINPPVLHVQNFENRLLKFNKFEKICCRWLWSLPFYDQSFDHYNSANIIGDT